MLTRGGGAVKFGVYATSGNYSAWIAKLFKYVGGALTKCRSHSIRWGGGALTTLAFNACNLNLMNTMFSILTCAPALRKSAVKWGVRSGAEQWTLVAAGRWANTSHSFIVYFKEGLHMKQEHMPVNGDKSIDPVHNFWLWTPTTGMYTT